MPDPHRHQGVPHPLVGAVVEVRPYQPGHRRAHQNRPAAGLGAQKRRSGVSRPSQAVRPVLADATGGSGDAPGSRPTLAGFSAPELFGMPCPASHRSTSCRRPDFPARHQRLYPDTRSSQTVGSSVPAPRDLAAATSYPAGLESVTEPTSGPRPLAPVSATGRQVKCWRLGVAMLRLRVGPSGIRGGLLASMVHDWRYRHGDFSQPVAHLKTALIWDWPLWRRGRPRPGHYPLLRRDPLPLHLPVSPPPRSILDDGLREPPNRTSARIAPTFCPMARMSGRTWSGS